MRKRESEEEEEEERSPAGGAEGTLGEFWPCAHEKREEEPPVLLL